MSGRTRHRAENRAACRAGVACGCGHCACDHWGIHAGGTFCDALTGADDAHDCMCPRWRPAWVVLEGGFRGRPAAVN